MSSRRKLTKSEISKVLSIVQENNCLPKAARRAYAKKTRDRLYEEIKDIEIYPEVFDMFHSVLDNKYNRSKIEAGESVGILCAQSIGEMNTQLTLNTFHSSGISDAQVTEGVPKFQELLSATKNPKMVNMNIFFKSKPHLLGDVRVLSSRLRGISINDLVLRYDIVEYLEIDSVLKCLYDLNDDFDMLGSVIVLSLDIRCMLQYNLYPSDIVDSLTKNFDDIKFCSDIQENNDVRVLCIPLSCELELLTETVRFYPKKYITEENKKEIYIEEVVLPLVLNVHVCGVKGIKDVFFEKTHSGEWYIQTMGGAFKKLLCLRYIDAKRCISNNVWDIYNVLGIEAARAFLIDEFTSIMSGLNMSHTLILVSRMTFNGSVSSISRYTLKNECSSILGKASFEESLENFLRASCEGAIERTSGASASIICGKTSRSGTGFFNLRIDTDAIIKK